MSYHCQILCFECFFFLSLLRSVQLGQSKKNITYVEPTGSSRNEVQDMDGSNSSKGTIKPTPDNLKGSSTATSGRK